MITKENPKTLKRVGKNENPSFMNILKTSLKIWKIEILTFTIRIF